MMNPEVKKWNNLKKLKKLKLKGQKNQKRLTLKRLTKTPQRNVKPSVSNQMQKVLEHSPRLE